MRRYPWIVAVALLVAACGGATPEPEASETTAQTTGAEPNTETVPADEFVDGMCLAMGDWLDVLVGGNDDLQQALAGIASPDEAVAVLAVYLDQTVEATDALIADVEALGAPDVDGGEDARDAILETFRGVRDVLAAAADEVSGLDTDDPDALTEALTQMSSDLTAATGDLVGPLARTTIPELEQAYADSTACNEVKSLGE